MPHDENWMRPADAVILDHLLEQRFDYVALIARDQQMPPSYTERRVEKLVDQNLLEPVSHEVVYRITERGRQVLEDYRDTHEEPPSIQLRSTD